MLIGSSCLSEMMSRLSQEVELLKSQIMQKRLGKFKSSQSSSGTESERKQKQQPMRPIYNSQSK